MCNLAQPRAVPFVPFFFFSSYFVRMINLPFPCLGLFLMTGMGCRAYLGCWYDAPRDDDGTVIEGEAQVHKQKSKNVLRVCARCTM